jgi:hypothetical protein
VDIPEDPMDRADTALLRSMVAERALLYFAELASKRRVQDYQRDWLRHQAEGCAIVEVTGVQRHLDARCRFENERITRQLVAALPHVVDLVGPLEGTQFLRLVKAAEARWDAAEPAGWA